MAKLKIEFDGFDEVLNRLKNLEADVKSVTEKALKESHNYVTPNVHSAIAPHNKSGDTERSIVENANVTWTGSTASVEVGFDLKNGGLPSVFLMFGTKAHTVLAHGTPRRHPGINADKKLYNSIYGSTTQSKVRQIQEDIFYEAIRKSGG